MDSRQALKGKIKKHGIYFLLSMTIFFLLNIPFKDIQFLEGYADFRISAIFPVASGLLMGPAGAIGCGFGNLFADFFGTLNEGTVFGFFANIIFAYLPYKLWHTIFPLQGHKPVYLSSANSLLKYLVITTFSVVLSMSVIAAGCDLMSILSYSRFLSATIMCNLIFAIFGGTIIFLVLTQVFKVSPYVPQKVYQYRYVHKNYTFDYILCAVIIVLQIITLVCAVLQGDHHNLLVDSLCAVLLCLIGILVCLPMTRSKERVVEQPVEYVYKGKLQRQLLLGFFVFSAVNITFYCVTTMFLVLNNYQTAQVSSSITSVWITVFEYNNMGSIIFLFALYIILRWMEKQVITPITTIADYSKRFVKGGLSAEKIHISNSKNEITELAESIETMSEDLVNYVKDRQKKIKQEESMKALFKAAKNIQMGILPEPLKENRPFNVKAFIKPAMEVGGDFYDFIRLSEDRFLVCIADVSSSGLPAAMFMTEASVLVKCYKDYKPNELLSRLNEALYENNSENMFVTMFVGVIDITKKVFEFSNAGHNYPIVWDKKGMQWLKTDPNPILGMIPGLHYDLHKIDIDDFFEIFLYTDGVNEAENELSEFYGNERLDKTCKALNIAEASLDTQLNKVRESLKDFTNNAPQSDDITMVFMQYNNS